MKNSIVVILISLVVLALGLFFLLEREAIPARSTVTINDTIFFVDVVDTPELRAQGLSGRETLAKGEGMLFIFEEEAERGFWMKEMNFSLDIVWLDRDRVVVEITKNATPESFPEIFRPERPAQYVLEINAGESDKKEIKVGDQAIFSLK